MATTNFSESLRQQRIKNAEGKSKLEKLQAQLYKGANLTPEQKEFNDSINKQIGDVKLRAKEIRANKQAYETSRETYDQRKAELKNQLQKSYSRGVPEDILQRELLLKYPGRNYDKFVQEDRKAYTAKVQQNILDPRSSYKFKDLPVEEQQRLVALHEDRVANWDNPEKKKYYKELDRQASKERAIKAKENLARTEASYARRAAEGKPVGTWTPATTATTATPATPRPAVGSNGMNAMASTITSSAPRSTLYEGFGFKKGGKVAAKKYAKGGKVSSAPKTAKASTASRRGDGIAQRGKTKGRIL